MVWNSKALWTETDCRNRYWVESAGRKGRPARRPKAARLTVSTARMPAVSPKIASKTSPKARRSFGRPSVRRDEVTGAQLHKGGKAEKATRTGGGEPAFAQGGDVMRDVVPGDDAGRGRAGAVEDVDLFFGQKPSRAGGRCQPFFLDRPSSARTCPTSRALTVAPIWETVSAISYLLPWVSKRVRMMRASTSF